MLLFTETGKEYGCTASMINTKNGNIGITAAHCLFGDNGQEYENMAFSPGYDRGANGPLGLIPVGDILAPNEYNGRNPNSVPYDYGFMKMEYNDPRGFKLQQYTGANGWRLDVEGDNIPTTAFGYPEGGNIPNCPNDGENLCMFVGNAKTTDTIYEMHGVNLGI